MELGKQIKKYRQELQLSQEELADHVYVSKNNSDYLQKARKYGHFTGYKN